jgi:hypothetical protein
MPLIARIPADHSIRDLRVAAGLPYREAQRLAMAGDRLAAIYLFGYVAEMLLKAAYFRLVGWTPTQPISLADLNRARAYANSHHGLHWPTNLHDLPRWRDLLVEERKFRVVPYPTPFLRSFNAHVRQVYLNWREHLRYRTNYPYHGEVTRVFQAVRWLMGQYRHL